MVIPAIGSNNYTTGSRGASSAARNTAATSCAPSAAAYTRVEREMAARHTDPVLPKAGFESRPIKITAQGQLANVLLCFRLLANDLAGNSLSAPGILSASAAEPRASAKVAGGTYAVDVHQLAQKQLQIHSHVYGAQQSASAKIGTGAAAGMKIEFGALSGGAPRALSAKVAVGSDAEQLAARVANMVGDYNALVGELQSMLKDYPDRPLGEVDTEWSKLFGGTANDAAMAKAGFMVGKNGDLQFDQAKFKSAIEANPNAAGIFGKLFHNNGKGLEEKIVALSAGGLVHNVESGYVSKEIATLNDKNALPARAPTAQSTALVKQYRQQEQAGAADAGPDSSGKSLFDFHA